LEDDDVTVGSMDEGFVETEKSYVIEQVHEEVEVDKILVVVPTPTPHIPSPGRVNLSPVYTVSLPFSFLIKPLLEDLPPPHENQKPNDPIESVPLCESFAGTYNTYKEEVDALQRALYGEEPVHHEFQNTERAISLIIEVEESIVRENNFHKESMPTFPFPSFYYSSFIIVFSFCSSSFRHPTLYWHRAHVVVDYRACLIARKMCECA
jgi:hypothetical protein